MNEIDVKWAKVKAVDTGNKIPCLFCKKLLQINSTKDVLCQVNGQAYGICIKCEPMFMKEIEKRSREGLKGYFDTDSGVQ